MYCSASSKRTWILFILLSLIHYEIVICQSHVAQNIEEHDFDNNVPWFGAMEGDESIIIDGIEFKYRDFSKIFPSLFKNSYFGSRTNNCSFGYNSKNYREYLSRPHPSVEGLNTFFKNASLEYNVPEIILKSIAHVETNWTQIGPSIDYGYGMMHLVSNGSSNTLDLSSKISGISAEQIKNSAEKNILAGAALLNHYSKILEIDKSKIENWFPVLSKYSALSSEELRDEQANQYLKIASEGIITYNIWGEIIQISKNNNISISNSKIENSQQNMSLDYPIALSDLVPSCNYGSRGNNEIDTWVNHWIGVGTYNGSISWFQTCPCPDFGLCPSDIDPNNPPPCPQGNQFRPCSYGPSSAHFIISKEGEITQLVDVSNSAYHAGAVGFNNNQRSIGVEHEATLTHPEYWNNSAMLNASSEMACYFTNFFDIPQSFSLPGCQGHDDMPGTNTACPGNLPWSTWLSSLQNSSNCGNDPVFICSEAIDIECNQTYFGNESNNISNVSFYGCNTWTETGPERVHRIVTTVTTDIIASISDFTGDLDVYILGSCDPEDCLGTVNSSSAFFQNAPPGEYYIIVDADDGSGSSYSLYVEADCSDDITSNIQIESVQIESPPALCGEEFDIDVDYTVFGNPIDVELVYTINGSCPTSDCTDTQSNIGNGETDNEEYSNIILVQGGTYEFCVAFYDGNTFLGSYCQDIQVQCESTNSVQIESVQIESPPALCGEAFDIDVDYTVFGNPIDIELVYTINGSCPTSDCTDTQSNIGNGETDNEEYSNVILDQEGIYEFCVAFYDDNSFIGSYCQDIQVQCESSNSVQIESVQIESPPALCGEEFDIDVDYTVFGNPIDVELVYTINGSCPTSDCTDTQSNIGNGETDNEEYSNILLAQGGTYEFCVAFYDGNTFLGSYCQDIQVQCAGCLDVLACNYDPSATVNNGTCIYALGCDECDGNGGVTNNPEIGDSCNDNNPNTVNDVYINCNICQGSVISGCTDNSACNYDPSATVNNGTCIYALGCDECDGNGGVTNNPEIGDSCNDNNSNTVNDVYISCNICQGSVISGCTDNSACNYDPSATVNNGTCIYALGCDECDGNGGVTNNPEIGDSCNDNNSNTVNDVYISCNICQGSVVSGCTDNSACNYDPSATVNNGTCIYALGCDECDGNGGVTNNPEIGDSCNDNNPNTVNDVYINCNICQGSVVSGCTDNSACNYDPSATVNNGTCIYALGCDECDGNGGVTNNPEIGDSCNDNNPNTVNDVYINCNICQGSVVSGCTDNSACNYDPSATVNNGTCIYASGCDECDGNGGVTNNPEIGDSCNDNNPNTVNDVYINCNICQGSVVSGCTDNSACNYDPSATVNNDTCIYALGCDECDGNGGVTNNPEIGDSCNDNNPNTVNDVYIDCMVCQGTELTVFGCTDSSACNYDPLAEMDDDSCEYISCCLPPTQLSTFDVELYSVTADWNTIEAANEYIIQIKECSESSWTTYSNSTTISEIFFENLECATCYNWRVKVNCENSDWSQTAEFVTSNSEDCETVGIAEAELLSFKINSSEALTITPSNSEQYSFGLYNIQGKLIHLNENCIGVKRFNTEHLSDGIYALRLMSKGDQMVKKIYITN